MARHDARARVGPVERPTRAPVASPALEAELGPSLASRVGPPVPTAAALAGKVVLLYFSAHWCPPCRQFTPMLVDFYGQMRASGRAMEVVFLSADHSETEFDSYFASMPWLAVPFRSSARETVPAQHNVQGIPALKVVSSRTGRVVDEDGRRRALTLATFEHWQSLCEQ